MCVLKWKLAAWLYPLLLTKFNWPCHSECCTLRVIIATHKDTVPWSSYICTLTGWTLMHWLQWNSSLQFDVSYSTKHWSLNLILWYDAQWLILLVECPSHHASKTRNAFQKDNGTMLKKLNSIMITHNHTKLRRALYHFQLEKSRLGNHGESLFLLLLQVVFP